MDKEMQKLGLKQPVIIDKKPTPCSMTSDMENNSNGQFITNLDDIEESDDLKAELDASDQTSYEESGAVKKTNKESEDDELRKRYTNNYYARRVSTIGVMTSKNVDSYVNISTMRRKYSLDSKLTTAKLLPSMWHRSHPPAQSISSCSSVIPSNKTSRRSSLSMSDDKDHIVGEPVDLKQISYSTLLSPSKYENSSDTMSVLPPPSVQSHSVKNVLRNSAASTNSKRRSSFASDYSSRNLLDSSDPRRRVSFGQIELSQLEIPTVYKHSNIGFEKYKSNPNFYLPDGSLRRRFSLPRMSETLDAVRNCSYLRHNVQKAAEQESICHDTRNVVNIFKDLDPTPSEMRNFDYAYPGDENDAKSDFNVL